MRKPKRKPASSSPGSPGKRPRTALMDPVPPSEQLVIAMMRAGWAIDSQLDKFFSRCGITLLQYNVLRILYVRDIEGTGLPTGTVNAVMMRLVPDVSRLIDRLVAAGHIERSPSPADRRVVLIKLTPQGHDVVEELHPDLLAHNRKLFEHMSDAEIERTAKGLVHAMEGPLGRRGE